VDWPFSQLVCSPLPFTNRVVPNPRVSRNAWNPPFSSI
jgi:hypothetical protein